MNTDFINDIKDAEEKAELMVKQANADAKSMVAQAHSDAAALLETERQKALQIGRDLVTQASADAEQQKTGIVGNAHTQAEAMRVLAAQKLERASAYIIERIVGADGNR